MRDLPSPAIAAAAMVLTLTLLTGHAARAEVVLVDDGEPRALVVVPDEPTEIATYAAEELVAHVELAAGVALPIVEASQADDALPHRVYIGATDAARDADIDPDDLPTEVAVVRTVGDAVYIVGRDEPGNPLRMPRTGSGTLWGVYELLERELGVRWLWPGELGTHVPQRDRVALEDLDWRVEPALSHRHWRTNSRHNDARWGFSEDGHRAYRQAERVFLRRHRMGTDGDVRPASSSHRFHGWWGRYGEDRLEWFAMSPDGERGPSEADRPRRVPMCVSDPTLHDYIIEQWQARREDRPDETHLISLGETNTWARCACDRCREWDETQPTEDQLAKLDPYIRRALSHVRTGEPMNAGPRYARFWKTIHRRAREIDPDAIVTTLVYMNYFAAPEQDMELHENLVLCFVPWTGWWFPRTDAEQQWVLRQWDRWRELGATLGYRPNFTYDGYAMPHVYTRQMAEAFKHYAAHGMIGTDFDSLVGQWANQGPTLYVLARLHTHPQRDVDALLEEYYGAFGPAADAVRDYFEHWEHHTMNLRDTIEDAKERYDVSRFTTYPRMSHELFPGSALDEGEALLDRAADAAKDAAPVYRERVSFLRDGLTHARHCTAVAALFADDDADADVRRAALEELASFRRSVEHRFIAAFNWLCHQERESWSEKPGFFE